MLCNMRIDDGGGRGLRRNRLSVYLLCGVALAWTARVPTASAVTIFEDVTNTVEVIDLTGFSTHGDDMAGMQVTFVGTSGATETVPWVATGAGAGGAIGGMGWQLREVGDTYDLGVPDGLWSLSTADLLIDRVIISGFDGKDNGASDGIVFDRTRPSVGTDGSAKGRDFEVDVFQTLANTDIEVTYRDLVDSHADVGGPHGDLFREVILDFVLPPSGGDIGGALMPSDRLLFRMDTDMVGIRMGDCRGPECPEPASASLAGLALLGTLLGRRRRSAD